MRAVSLWVRKEDNFQSEKRQGHLLIKRCGGSEERVPLQNLVKLETSHVTSLVVSTVRLAQIGLSSVDCKEHV